MVVGLRPLLGLIHLSFACFLVFTAFGATQNLLSSLLQKDNLGYYTLATIYAAFCVGALLVAPIVNAWLDCKWAMSISSITYALFMAANLFPSPGLMLPAAALLGIGASVFWTGHGSFLTLLANNYAAANSEPAGSAMGRFTGIFFAIFQINSVVGNILGALVLSKNHSEHTLFFIFLAIAGAGVVLIFLLSKPPSHDTAKEAELAETAKQEPVISKILAALLMIPRREMLLCIPTLFFSGVQAGLASSVFTAKIIKPSIGVSNLGYVMAVLGASDVLGSYACGWLADRTSKKVIVYIGVLTWMIFYYFFAVLLWDPSPGRYIWLGDHEYILYVFAVLGGLGDAAYNCLPAILMGLLFKDETAPAFANLKLWQSLGYVFIFLLGPKLTFVHLAFAAGGFAIVSCVTLVVLDFIHPMDVKRL